MVRRRPSSVTLVRLALVMGLLSAPGARAGEAAPQQPALPAAPALAAPLLTRSDAWFGAGAAAAVALAGTTDHRTWDAVRRADSARRRDVAQGLQSLGSPEVVLPAVVLGYAAGRMLAKPGLSRASERVAIAVGVAGAASMVIKAVVGRSRPRQAPGDPDVYRPFSGDASFPSGHTTVAFAAAAALDRECGSPWVRLVAYPAAAAVGWARVEQDEHWVSDVVAGAALGWWTAGKVERFVRAHGIATADADGRVGLVLTPAPRGLGLGVRMRF